MMEIKKVLLTMNNRQKNRKRKHNRNIKTHLINKVRQSKTPRQRIKAAKKRDKLIRVNRINRKHLLRKLQATLSDLLLGGSLNYKAIPTKRTKLL